jgi:predicted  nucleic acid-binding Zn-ribbon protein
VTEEEVSLKDVLQRLIELQKLDSQILHLESLRGDLPHQVSRLNEELKEAEQNLESMNQKLQDFQKENDMIEMEIKALEGKKQKYQSQLFEVKNNREYDAVTHEIESVKDEIGKKETRILELMDANKEMKTGIETTNERVKELQEQFHERKSELDKRMEKTEKDEIALKDQRGKLVRKLEPRLLASYERIKKAKHNLAVVPVIGNACGGCFKTLPPQRILEVRAMNRLYLCEVCGRILTWDDEKSEGLK